ncbi:hypothetical protein MHL31_05180 [Lutibacter sp. A80]|uniref:hypothetical protein n=1 Tax=Lutibacter sp. A80 TaxID=2918453 RepID=UPI001F0691AA|nr:hypothetical protein [Lutibacter sp. A80]UMB61599.1 hypothetical protein MHL31_05180 [Lutibacter sp. A80]
MNERDLRVLKNWEKKQKMGKWKYIAVYGGFFMVLILIFRNGSDYFLDKLPSNFFTIQNLLKQLVSSALGGLSFGLISWFMNERTYKKLVKNK